MISTGGWKDDETTATSSLSIKLQPFDFIKKNKFFFIELFGHADPSESLTLVIKIRAKIQNKIFFKKKKKIEWAEGGHRVNSKRVGTFSLTKNIN